MTKKRKTTTNIQNGRRKYTKREMTSIDGMYDPYTTRGGNYDKTSRLLGKVSQKPGRTLKAYYFTNGFVQNIVDTVAEDSIREWFQIVTNKDTETIQVSEMIQQRLTELGFKDKLKNCIRYSRIYPKGSFLYYGVIGNTPQVDLSQPLPDEIDNIDFINVIQDTDSVSIHRENQNPLSSDYNDLRIVIWGDQIHKSRYSWLVNKFDEEELTGISVVHTIWDAISAQDSALWSVSSLCQQLAYFIFKSDFVVGLPPAQMAEILQQLRHIADTQGGMALGKDEDLEKHTLSISGIKEVFDFIFENLSGFSGIPKNILQGKAHGVVTAGEYDTLNYYAEIEKFQENILKPIISKCIDLIIMEKKGDVYKYKDGLEYEINFNNLWRLDPLSEADKQLKNAQRDDIDINDGKLLPEEAREMDERMSELKPFSELDIRITEGKDE